MPASTVRSAALVFALASAIATALTWPLVLHLGTKVPHDLGDPVLNTWILGWNASHVPLTSGWWNGGIFFPAANTLAFSEHLLGLTPLSSPVIWLTGSALVGYNVTFLLTFPLSALTAWLLGFELTGRRSAALIGALAFAFAPYRIAHLSHLQILATFWMPLALLGLHRYITAGGARWLALFGVAWWMQALSNGYFLAFLPVLIFLWVIWFVRRANWRAGVRIAAAWGLAVVALLPILLTYRSTHAHFGLARSVDMARSLSADVASFLDASPLLAWWGSLRAFPQNEGQLFTGFTILVVILAGIAGWLVRRPAGVPSRALLFYLCSAVIMFALALGPSPSFLGTRVLDFGPYLWLMQLPGVNALRAPARFGMLMVLCLSIAASLAFAIATLTWSRVWRTCAAAAIGALIVAESWMHAMPLWDPPREWDLRSDEVSGALLVLPVLNELNEAATMYRTMDLGQPIVNGYSGHIPSWYRVLKEGLNDLDPAVLDVLAEAGVRHIAVVTRNDSDSTWRNYVRTRGTLKRVSGDGAYTYFDLPAPVRARPRSSAPEVPVAAISAEANPGITGNLLDGNLTTRWFRTGPQQGDEVLTIDLGVVRPVAAVELTLGNHEFDYPREVVVEISDDGRAWTEVWRGRGAAPTIAAAFASPSRIPLQFDLGGRAGRFIRLRQLARHRSASWSVAELAVRGQ